MCQRSGRAVRYTRTHKLTGWNFSAVWRRFFCHARSHISPERYTGVLSYYTLEWTHSHQPYVYKLNLEFRQSSEFRNNNVSSEVSNYRLSQGFLYPLKARTLFRMELGLWIGPTTDIYHFENHPEIAVLGFDYTNSLATLISLGFRGDTTGGGGVVSSGGRPEHLGEYTLPSEKRYI